MKMIATKARRHQGFTFKKTFCVTLCFGVLVAKTGNQMKPVRLNPVKVKKMRSRRIQTNIEQKKDGS